MPAGAFGDSLSGMALAGGIAESPPAGERTGKGGLVDVALLARPCGPCRWHRGRTVSGATVPADDTTVTPPPPPFVLNPMVKQYRTADGRWLALCMLQARRYWRGVMEVVGRPD